MVREQLPQHAGAGAAVDPDGAAVRPLDLDPRRGRTTSRRRWRSPSALVIMVIFLFLRSVSATIIPALAVPVSLIGTCAAMYAFGFSINNMTLLALTLSVGFVVDDAIVMLENIVRHIEGGMRPFEAALKGSREIGFTIVSITFSLIAVFIPVLLMGGMVGRVFREFAVTIAVAIIVSGFVSLTLTPMLCARVLNSHHGGEKQNFVLRAFERGFEARAERLRADARPGAAGTSRSCWWSRSRTIAGTIWLYIIVPKGFFPIEDTGFVLGITEGNTDIGVRGDGRAPAQGRRHRPRGPGGRLRQLDGRRRRPQFAAQQRPHVGRAQAAERARQARRDHGAAAARGQCRHRHGGLLPADPEHQSRRQLAKSQYQYTLQSNDTDDALPHRAGVARQDRQASRAARRHHRPLHQESADRRSTSTARRRRSTASPSIRSARSSTTPSARVRSRRSTRRPTTIRSSSRRCRNIQTEPSDLDSIYLKTTNGTVGAAVGGDAFRAVGRAAAGQPSGPAAGGDDLVQPRARHLARPGGRRHQQARARRAAAGVDHHRLPGHRAGVPGFAARAGRADAGGDLCRLRRARHSLRELHPPDHHHLRPAVGRHRRAAHADAVQDGPVGDRHDRHRHAGRHRQEERHHDDRLRARAPPRRPRRRGRDPRGLRCCASARS